MKTIAVYSLKGGVGKTTLAVNLAWCAAAISKRRTVLWDLDAQAAATWLMNGAPPARAAIALFARDAKPGKLVRPTAIPNLDLIGADASLRGLDRLFDELDKKKRLAKLIEALGGNYERVVLDCPPGVTETADQVVRGADLVVVPVIPSPLSQRAFEETRAHVGDRVPLLPVHVMVDRRRAVHAAALAAAPDWPVVPMASLVEKMAVRRLPLGDYAPASPAARAFALLWREVERTLTRK